MKSTFEVLSPVATGEDGQPVTGYADADAIPLIYGAAPDARHACNFWTLWYRAVFRLRGIRFGKGLRVLGPLMLQLDGSPRNIQIGTNVTLMPHVHLKVRENGRVILHDRVALDTGVRLIAANDARIEIGENSSLGLGSVVNAGMDVVIGRGTITAGYCYFNVSDHGLARGTPIREQGFRHAPIAVGEDVWLGAHVFVRRGARIGNGVVVSTGSMVIGDIPANAIIDGRPAQVRRHRQ